MKYRLKDRELQRKLEDLDDGDFTDFPIRLNETINDLLTVHQWIYSRRCSLYLVR